MVLQSLFKKRKGRVGFKLFFLDNLSIKSKFEISLGGLILFKQPKRLRINKNSVSQYADPFAIEYNHGIYVFYEKFAKNSVGVIEVAFSLDLVNWHCKSVSLGSVNHFSFPFLFRDNDFIFLIPESAALKEVALYKPLRFPETWEKKKTILVGDYVDSHLLKLDGIYYLFTTKKTLGSAHLGHTYDYTLELFVSNSISGEYLPHPSSPLLFGRAKGRSAGSVVERNGKLYRLAQDCSKIYGDDIFVFEIEVINQFEYKEIELDQKIIRQNGLSEFGGHHLNIGKIGQREFLLVDLNLADSFFQRFVNKWQKIVK